MTHQRTQSGAPDWQDVPRLTAEDRAQALRERVAAETQRLGRQLTAAELESALAAIEGGA